MQKLGQHFLKNKSVLKKIADEILASAGEAPTIVEIGAGHGELTEELANCELRIANCENPLKIIAVEKDAQLAELLRKKFSSDKNVEIIEGDIRKLLPALASHLASRTLYTLAGNIPYYLTAHLLRIIGELPARPGVCILTVQKEVAERLSATPPAMNRLAACVQYWAVPKIVLRVPRRDFSPPPNVDSAVLTLKTRSVAAEKKDEKYFSLVRALFAQPRKTVLNNLTASGMSREKAGEYLRRVGINPLGRPQNLPVGEIEKLARILSLSEGK